MIEVKIRFWTDNLSPEKGKIVPRHAWASGVVRIERNDAHGLKPGTPIPFNSLLDLGAAVEKALIEHGVVLHIKSEDAKVFRLAFRLALARIIREGADFRSRLIVNRAHRVGKRGPAHDGTHRSRWWAVERRRRGGAGDSSAITRRVTDVVTEACEATPPAPQREGDLPPRSEIGRRGRQMDHDPADRDDDMRAQFEEPVAQPLHLDARTRRPCGAEPEFLHQHIGGRREEHAELIRPESAATRPADLHAVVEFLDPVFDVPAGAARRVAIPRVEIEPMNVEKSQQIGCDVEKAWVTVTSEGKRFDSPSPRRDLH